MELAIQLMGLGLAIMALCLLAWVRTWPRSRYIATDLATRWIGAAGFLRTPLLRLALGESNFRILPGVESISDGGLTIGAGVLGKIFDAIPSVKDALVHSSKYTGVVKIPRRAYVGNTILIEVELRRWLSGFASTSPSQSLSLVHEGESHTDFRAETLHSESPKEAEIEIEIRGAAFRIDGDRKQRQAADSEGPLAYSWNVFLENSGKQTVELVIRTVHGETTELIGTLRQNLRVVKIGNLTSRQVWVLTALSGSVTAILASLYHMKRLGWF